MYEIDVEQEVSQITSTIDRIKLEQRYLEAACAYVNLATDEFHTYEIDDLRDPRFLVEYEVSMHPRYQSLADSENSTAKQHKIDKELLLKTTLLAHLSLLSGARVRHEDIQSNRKLLPSIIYRDLLRSAGVISDGIYTQSIDSYALESLLTPEGDKFSSEFIDALRTSTSTAEMLPQDNSSSHHLQLVA